MRHPNIEFEQFHPSESRILRGEVVVRGDEMLLCVELPREGPYNIEGQRNGIFYVGRHRGTANEVPVRAKWMLFDEGTYIGQWFESGRDYLFRFHLPEHG